MTNLPVAISICIFIASIAINNIVDGGDRCKIHIVLIKIVISFISVRPMTLPIYKCSRSELYHTQIELNKTQPDCIGSNRMIFVNDRICIQNLSASSTALYVSAAILNIHI